MTIKKREKRESVGGKDAFADAHKKKRSTRKRDHRSNSSDSQKSDKREKEGEKKGKILKACAAGCHRHREVAGVLHARPASTPSLPLRQKRGDTHTNNKPAAYDNNKFIRQRCFSWSLQRRNWMHLFWEIEFIVFDWTIFIYRRVGSALWGRQMERKHSIKCGLEPQSRIAPERARAWGCVRARSLKGVRARWVSGTRQSKKSAPKRCTLLYHP